MNKFFKFLFGGLISAFAVCCCCLAKTNVYAYSIVNTTSSNVINLQHKLEKSGNLSSYQYYSQINSYSQDFDSFTFNGFYSGGSSAIVCSSVSYAVVTSSSSVLNANFVNLNTLAVSDVKTISYPSENGFVYYDYEFTSLMNSARKLSNRYLVFQFNDVVGSSALMPNYFLTQYHVKGYNSNIPDRYNEGYNAANIYNARGMWNFIDYVNTDFAEDLSIDDFLIQNSTLSTYNLSNYVNTNFSSNTLHFYFKDNGCPIDFFTLLFDKDTPYQITIYFDNDYIYNVVVPSELFSLNKEYIISHFDDFSNYILEFTLSYTSPDSAWNINTDSSYNYGYQSGINSVNTDKYFNDGYIKGKEEGKEIGHIDGYQEAISDSSDNNLLKIFVKIPDIFINSFQTMLNFDFLGINIFDFVASIFTLLIVVAVIKKFIS